MIRRIACCASFVMLHPTMEKFKEKMFNTSETGVPLKSARMQMKRKMKMKRKRTIGIAIMITCLPHQESRSSVSHLQMTFSSEQKV
jgi:hypothetical protein